MGRTSTKCSSVSQYEADGTSAKTCKAYFIKHDTCREERLQLWILSRWSDLNLKILAIVYNTTSMRKMCVCSKIQRWEEKTQFSICHCIPSSQPSCNHICKEESKIVIKAIMWSELSKVARWSLRKEKKTQLRCLHMKIYLRNICIC